ncbi:hypothetical protein [Massilia psychrophila]|uniref:hypothetical protein n=1 Tax=Massilia psychrophila TaxID=1603353 RepID=UPI0015D4A6D0|nr:hypothetical protein [Massilia psychrophila]
MAALLPASIGSRANSGVRVYDEARREHHDGELDRHFHQFGDALAQARNEKRETINGTRIQPSKKPAPNTRAK